MSLRSPHEPATIDLAKGLIDICVVEIDRTFPLESGGVLMGRWASQSHAIVERVIGPGPKARHERYRFMPDLEWQHAKIAEHYRASSGLSTYLGDWHSHPGAMHGELSAVDKRAIRAIIETPEAQCAAPLMAIFWGVQGMWELAVWRGILRPRRLFGPRIDVTELTLG